MTKKKVTYTINERKKKLLEMFQNQNWRYVFSEFIQFPDWFHIKYELFIFQIIYDDDEKKQELTWETTAVVCNLG